MGMARSMCCVRGAVCALSRDGRDVCHGVHARHSVWNAWDGRHALVQREISLACLRFQTRVSSKSGVGVGILARSRFMSRPPAPAYLLCVARRGVVPRDGRDVYDVVRAQRGVCDACDRRHPRPQRDISRACSKSQTYSLDRYAATGTRKRCTLFTSRRPPAPARNWSTHSHKQHAVDSTIGCCDSAQERHDG